MTEFEDKFSTLLQRADRFESTDKKKAARNLSNARVFLISDEATAAVYPIYWILHVRGQGRFSDSKHSNQDLERFRPALLELGYVEISEVDEGFEAAWDALLVACDRLVTSPSNRSDTPDWRGRRFFVKIKTLQNFPDELPNDQSFPEGLSQKISVNRFERNKAARMACITNHRDPVTGGIACACCAIDFAALYGADIGKGFIHVHHLVPLSQIGEAYEINPATDLVPVCPNCHSMMHRVKPPLKVQDIRHRLKIS